MTANERKNLLALAVVGAALTIVSALLWWHMNADPAITQPRNRDPGPGFQPGITLILLGLCSIGLCATSLRRYFRLGGRIAGLSRQRAGAELARLSVPVAMVVSLLAFVWLAAVIGFLATSVLFTTGWTLFLALQDADHTKRSVVVAALGAVAAAGLLYVLFNLVIGIPL